MSQLQQNQVCDDDQDNCSQPASFANNVVETGNESEPQKVFASQERTQGSQSDFEGCDVSTQIESTLSSGSAASQNDFSIINEQLVGEPAKLITVSSGRSFRLHRRSLTCAVHHITTPIIYRCITCDKLVSIEDILVHNCEKCCSCICY